MDRRKSIEECREDFPSLKRQRKGNPPIIQVDNNFISDIKYQCIGDPASNVAIEIFCTLVKGKTLDEVALIKEDAFSQFLGCEDELMREKAKSLLELLNVEIHRYKTQKE
ncbi:MAG: hypothetical protein A4E53_02516 [Pelotomaculum sp. PtaB.Bin104]|nr:MAG: hypothetical protein A4E53_02516 [Pelotomaculum sp. PtaB.Bin104]